MFIGFIEAAQITIGLRRSLRTLSPRGGTNSSFVRSLTGPGDSRIFFVHWHKLHFIILSQTNTGKF